MIAIWLPPAPVRASVSPIKVTSVRGDIFGDTRTVARVISSVRYSHDRVDSRARVVNIAENPKCDKTIVLRAKGDERPREGGVGERASERARGKERGGQSERDGEITKCALGIV